MLAVLQPTRIILPTRELVDEFLASDCQFFFYRNGVKGVIRDSIAMTNGLATSDEELHSRLLDSVISEFDQYEINCVDAGMFPKGLQDPESIQLLVDNIDCRVYEFLHDFFGGTQYEIMRPIDYIDRDLMVYARRF